MPERTHALLTDVDDPRLVELRRKVREGKPHVPKPGDADYQTPEQIARIKKELDSDED